MPHIPRIPFIDCHYVNFVLKDFGEKSKNIDVTLEQINPLPDFVTVSKEQNWNGLGNR